MTATFQRPRSSCLAKTSQEAIEEQLQRIAERDDVVGAWAHLDPELARLQAAKADAERPRSTLHGMSVGLKDIIETSDQPTGYGSPMWAGHRPAHDAEAVRRLRRAGAIVMGKTTTTEFATYHPTQTRNPHNLDHTPGGSSSGSAAAVADGQVRLALGTQTAGSVLRPGSFCGVFTVKPTYGRWPFTGVLPVALTFDTLGGFARDPRDLLQLDSVLSEPDLGASIADNQPLPPVSELRVGIVRGPWWDRAESEAQQMLQDCIAVISGLVDSVQDVDTPTELAALEGAHSLIQSLEAGAFLAPMIGRDPRRISDLLRQELAEAAAASADTVQSARTVLHAARSFVAHTWDHVDLLVTLAAPGEAPRGMTHTGDPVFNRLASTAGTPAIGLPIGRGAHGLPLGLQIIAPSSTDRALLSLAVYLTDVVGLADIPSLPECGAER